MWWWSGIGAVVWILASVAVALTVGQMVRRADIREQIHAQPPFSDTTSSIKRGQTFSRPVMLTSTAVSTDAPRSLRV